MIDTTPEIPLEFQPDPAELSFDLDRVLASMVSLRTDIPEDAFTAPTLGTERQGHGVVIREGGLILTIGYLIVEAEQIWMIDSRGRAIAGHPLGYDQETGFGLIQALDPSGLTPVEIGRSEDLAQGDPVILAGAGGRSYALQSEVVSIREFAGYWEYLLDEALFISPAHPFWGGGALFGLDGTLRGIGSLYVQNAIADDQHQEGNMVVPIDLLEPILDELSTTGRSGRPQRPWLGMFTAEAAGKVVVAGLWNAGPAEQAGIEVGDLVLEVDGTPVIGMADMLRRIWALGEPGIEVPLIIFRDRSVREIRIASSSRSHYYKAPRMH
ncbi:MAG: S1C family serine protease [Proteobacteria bacterium]|nr:S1C family serine protease [Pseudomonadota bacterium]MDA1023799.1 S1C family serine protease [Pseudomonadota bacterium]